ncbi:uro-adherence factor A-like [Argopecten irradians]|uniref:uro-adherence factor A-like n=1 Tax=Argopecten irradians TaxID=31199 RepID=UPI003710378A
MKLDLVPSPLLQEMEQIASDMSSLAEDISKSPVLAAEESPEITEYYKTESSNADDTSLSVSCHSADVFVVRDSEYEMSDDNTSPVESSTNNQDMYVIAISPDEATLKLIEAQATEATVLDFSSSAREKLASISSEVIEYSKSQEGKSSLATEDVVFTGQFISDPVDEAELAREISLADISSQSTEGLKVNVFVTANTESSEPSSPLAKYDVVEDLSVSVEKLSSEEITLPLPAAEEEKTTEESFQAQSETQDDSPTMRALHRRQKYLAEQAKKKELFEGSGHTEDNDAVKSYKTSIEISQENVLPKIPDESYIKESKPKMSNSAAFEKIKPMCAPLRASGSSSRKYNETPPKELVSDLMKNPQFP